jgi:hypothetical protein
VNRAAVAADTPDVPSASDGYFVRLDAAPSARHAPVARTAVAERPPSQPSPPRKKRRRPVRIRVLPLVLLALGGWAVYLQTKPGGVSGQVNDWIDKVRGNVEGASANPDLRRASEYFNAAYAKNGSYPAMTDDQLRDDPNAGFGIGVDTLYCNPQAMVLQSLTGSGTVSRLLLDGKDLGDVSGRIDCPTNFQDPKPWKLGG